MGGAAVFVLIGLVIAGVIAIALYLDYLRKEFWRKVAARYGLTYSPGDPLDVAGRYPFSLLQQGHSRRTSNTVHGEYGGRPVVLFDYTYKTGSGKNQSTHSLSALIVEMPLLGCALSVRPENFLDRFASFLGFDDINFELEQFNRAFRVNCESKKFAYDVFHTGMMEFMLTHPRACFEWQGHAMLITYGQCQFDEAKVDDALETARGFVERLPNFLLTEAKG